MNDLTPAFVRTAVPLIVGPLVARYGFDADDPTVAAALAGVIGWLYYVLVRLVELKAPTVGYLLGIAKAPAYSDRPPPQPAPALAEDVDGGGVVTAARIESGVITMERLGSPSETPVQTDNTPKAGDGPQLDDELSGLTQSWTGKEMR